MYLYVSCSCVFLFKSIEKNLGHAMAMAPNPASPVALCHLSTESIEGSYVPTFQNVEGEIFPASNQGCSGNSTIYFVEDQSLGPKISKGLATYVEDCYCTRILSSN